MARPDSSIARVLDATPPAEHRIDQALVQKLLADQHPDLSQLNLRAVGEGWDNVMFRLGDNLVVRLPRRSVAASLIGNEQRWLPLLSRQVTLPIPAPVRLGRPGRGYPWNWSILPWLTGQTADETEPAPSQAAVLGRFLRSLHVPAPLDAPVNPVRGVPLGQRAASVQERLERLAFRTNHITPGLRRIWDNALEKPLDTKPTWLHGDLHPRNILVDQGIITGIIDWGDLTSGDTATDLSCCWMLFGAAPSRADFWIAYGEVSEATRCRAKGWALFFGLMLLDTGLSNNPTNAKLGGRILQQLG